jgi:hypothetical protein
MLRLSYRYHLRLAKAYTGEHAQNVDVSVAVLDGRVNILKKTPPSQRG